MSFDIICFDCDSTLSKIEGIDELARRVGLLGDDCMDAGDRAMHGAIAEEMSRLTDAAMNGVVPLEAVYERRLSMIRPDQDSVNWLADLYVAEIVDGAKEVFETLLAPRRVSSKGKEVHIISGGIRQAILPLARYLGLPETHVHAVDVYFNEDGSYHLYDQSSPLARSGGKAEICRQLIKPQGSMVMIGDGKTDMEAKQAGVSVIGFGGVVDRPVVREQADFYCAEPSLVSILAHIL